MGLPVRIAYQQVLELKVRPAGRSNDEKSPLGFEPLRAAITPSNGYGGVNEMVIVI